MLNKLKTFIKDNVLHPETGRIKKFFDLPYAERVAEVKRLYSHEIKKQQLGDYFNRDEQAIQQEIDVNFRLYFDLVLNYALAWKPSAVLQLGSFTMTESQWLALSDFQGRIIASDYSQAHLDYLENGFKNGPLGRVEYRVVDIEYPKAEYFDGIEMVVAIAVLSNIQPEGMEKFFAALRDSNVKQIMIGDSYLKESLAVDPESYKSYPYYNSRNWAHPYMALASKYGFNAFFLPDFTYSSFLEARGIFVISRELPEEIHRTAIAEGFWHYVQRQDAIWPNYRGA